MIDQLSVISETTGPMQTVVVYLNPNTSTWKIHGIGFVHLSDLPFAGSSTISTGSSLSAIDTWYYTFPVKDMSSSSPSTMHTHLKCCVYNARSVMDKLCGVAVILETDKPDIVAITETFLCEHSEIVNVTYQVFCASRRQLRPGN